MALKSVMDDSGYPHVAQWMYMGQKGRWVRMLSSP